MPRNPKNKKVEAPTTKPATKPATKTEHVKPEHEHGKKHVEADKRKGHEQKGKAK